MTIVFKVKGKGIEHDVVVDDVDADLLRAKNKWNVWHPKERTSYYVKRVSYGKTIFLHRAVMERVIGRKLERHERVDHRDLNGLNNTRENLRIATNGQNSANRSATRLNKLGVKGVTLRGSRYRASITTNGDRKHLGTFDTIEQAHAAYMEAAIKYHGEFARGE